MTEILTGFVDSRTTVQEALERFEEIQWFWRRLGQPRILAGCSNSSSSKAATSEDARRTLRYVELLSEARTPLADCFSILKLLDACLAL